ncbi:MAG: LysE family transporter [Elusimicrobiota bacterium]
MELLLIFFGSFFVAFSGALTPGPLLTVTIAHTIKRGVSAGPLVVAGHMILEIGMLVFIVLGLQKYILIPSVMKTIFIIGGLILFFMGYSFIKNRKEMVIKKENESKSKMFSSPLASGIAASFSNPYWSIWWVTIGLGYVIKSLRFGILGIGLFFAGHILADFVWYYFISFSFSKGKKYININKYQIFILLCGIFLIFFGIWFFIEGLKKQGY